MKYLFICPLLLCLALLPKQKHVEKAAKLEITKIDSTRFLYIFRVKGLPDSSNIIFAEIDLIETCKPFKKFIIADSVQTTFRIKEGYRTQSFNSHMGYTSNGIVIKYPYKPMQKITNCASFTD